MKKLTIIIFATLFLTSCDREDKIVSLAIISQQSHVDNYNKIRRMTEDTAVINYIDKIKAEYIKEAYEVKGMVETAEKKDPFEKFDSSKFYLSKFIDSLQKK
jgi:hypothetical protein